MAFCSNCGARLPESAKFCPECGSSLSPQISPVETALYDGESIEQQYSALRIERRAANNAIAIPAKVYCNGEYIGSVKNGGYMITEVPSGYIHLDIRMAGCSGGQADVFISADTPSDTVIFRVAGLNSHIEWIGGNVSQNNNTVPSQGSMLYAPSGLNVGVRKCPRCGGQMTTQVISESRKSGCGTILLYVLLTLTIFGLLIVIPLALRKETETVTYAVCQNCGHKVVLNRER